MTEFWLCCFCDMVEMFGGTAEIMLGLFVGFVILGKNYYKVLCIQILIMIK